MTASFRFQLIWIHFYVFLFVLDIPKYKKNLPDDQLHVDLTGISPQLSVWQSRPHCLRRFYHARTVTRWKYHYFVSDKCICCFQGAILLSPHEKQRWKRDNPNGMISGKGEAPDDTNTVLYRKSNYPLHLVAVWKPQKVSTEAKFFSFLSSRIAARWNSLKESDNKNTDDC